MKSSREILKAHYLGLARKAAVWVGAASLIATSLIAAPASALGTQMGARSATASSLKAGLTTASYTISFKVGTSGAIGSLKLEICDSPLESVACVASASAGVNSNGANLASSTFPGGGLTGTNCTGGTWVTNGTTAGGTSGTAAKWKNTGAAAGTATSANACSFTTTTVTNPAGNNQHYYMRLTTYSDNNNAVEVDFGGFALMTAQDLTISASVQEALTFCVGDTVTTGCASAGSGAISLGTGTNCPVLSTSNVCTGTSQFAASTNATSGYTITYNAPATLTGPSDTITANGSPGATSTPGSKQFGLAVTTKTGAGSGAINATYDFSGNGSKYAFIAAAPQTIATAAGTTAENIYTVTYAANVDATTKPGLYTATFNYVCTGLF